MSQEKIEFIGIPSGDGECFFWEVDRETWASRLTETEIADADEYHEDTMSEMCNPDLPRIYEMHPEIELLSAIGHYSRKQTRKKTKTRYRVTMQIERIDDAE